jgi:hypothetical protein
MRLVLAVCCVLALLGCGSKGQTEDRGLRAQPGTTRATLISVTNGGGARVGSRLQPLDTPTRLRAFASRFDARLRARIMSEAPRVDVQPGEVLAGAVAYVGCGKPVDAEVIESPGGPRLQPGETRDENIECLVAVTTVGLVGVDRSLF